MTKKIYYILTIPLIIIYISFTNIVDKIKYLFRCRHKNVKSRVYMVDSLQITGYGHGKFHYREEICKKCGDENIENISEEEYVQSLREEKLKRILK